MGSGGSNFIDLTGRRFERLTVLERCSYNYGSKAVWKCKCDCGSIREIPSNNLSSGNSKSCGCYNTDRHLEIITTHGDSFTRLYKVWSNMRSRCENSNFPRYSYYGGRGIEICKRWKRYENFKKDMYLSYCIHLYFWGEDNTTIDRIDNNGNYTPDNCRWATNKTQVLNSRKMKRFKAVRISDGFAVVTNNKKKFAKDYGLPRSSDIFHCLSGKQKSCYGWKFYKMH